MATGNATFETQALTWQAWDKGHLTHSRLVALPPNGTVLAWAALSPVSGRCVYGGWRKLVCTSPPRRVDRQLLQVLIQASEATGIWALQAGTFAEKAASIGLHTQVGFRVIGHRERIGQHHGVWRNTVQMERRSPTVGIA